MDLKLDAENAVMEQLKESLNRTRIGVRIAEHDRDAAVMLPLVWRDEQWNILFEVRSSRLRMQPGEVCLPGGGIEENERPEHTAVREACEELQIEETQIELLGEIDGTIGPTGAVMYAYAAILHGYKASFSPEEVEEVFFVPLRELLEMEPVVGYLSYHAEPEADFPTELIPDYEHYMWKERKQRMPFYPWTGKMIWGATGRIVEGFLKRIRV